MDNWSNLEKEEKRHFFCDFSSKLHVLGFSFFGESVTQANKTL